MLARLGRLLPAAMAFGLIAFILLPWLFPSCRNACHQLFLAFLPDSIYDKGYAGAPTEIEYKSAKANAERLQTEMTLLRPLKERVQELERQQGIPLEEEVVLTQCRVVQRGPENWRYQLIIAFDPAAKVSVGTPLVVKGNVVGRVLDTWRGHARVATLLDNSCRLSCRVEGTQAYGILEGEALKNPGLAERFYCRLVGLPRDIPLRPDSLVSTSGLGGDAVPAGLLVGRVVSSNVDELSTTAVVELSAPLAGFPYGTLTGRSAP
ncbi:MAG: rod shape-determining protein MreC [Verrucomicrobiota bacterium]|jgi:cell shape-determining protein MreC